jgi:transcriptional regulator with XRE-family HTH domain
MLVMGSARPRPRRLAEKLLQIRQSLALSQSDLVKQMGVAQMIHYTNISKYELDKNEPPLMVLLAYAKVAQVHLEEIVDDDIDLPHKLPGTFDYYGRLAESPKT